MENVIYIFANNFANVEMNQSVKDDACITKKVLKYGEQDMVFMNLVWVIIEVSLK